MDVLDQQPLRAAIHFPIEGKSPWVSILRVMALGSLAALGCIAAMMVILHENGGKDLPFIMMGLGLFLLMEYFIVRLLIVPRFADYGRFRVYPHKVDYFPLGMSGLTVSDNTDTTPMDDFSGLTVRAVPDRGQYKVMLLHAQPGRSICLKTYTAAQPALAHAEALAQALSVAYAPSKVTNKPANSRAA